MAFSPYRSQRARSFTRRFLNRFGWFMDRGNGASGPQPWRPDTALAGRLFAWWDAQTPATVILNEGNVAIWADRSQNGWSMQQSNAVNQPAYAPNGWRGYPAVTRRDDFGSSAVWFTPVNAPGIEASIVGQPWTVAVAGNCGAYLSHYLWTDQTTLGGFATARDDFIAYNDRLALSTQQRPANNSDVIQVFQINPNATSPKRIRVNGGATELTSAGDTVLPTGWEGQTRTLRLGDFSRFSGQGNYLLGEVMLIVGAMTQEETEALEGYLAHRWGLTGNLPELHPYKNDAPLL